MIARLLLVELRKCVDTRAARVLLAVLVLLSTGTALLSSTTAPTLSQFISAAVLPLPLLLPILAILTVTSDWTQRSAVTTFAIVPRRGRILAARASAAVLFVVFTVVVIACAAGLVFVIVYPAEVARTDWADLRRSLWSILAISLSASLSGVAIGSLVLNTPVAIVVTMLLPITYDIAVATRFPAVAPWISSLAFSEWLADPHWTWTARDDMATGLGSALCSLLLWSITPLALGWFRQLRKEVR